MLSQLFALPRPHKRALQVLADAALLTFSFILAVILRTEGIAPLRHGSVWLAFAAVMLGTLILFIKIGFYRAVVRYLGLRAFATIVNGVIASAGALALLAFIFKVPVPGTVPLIYGLISLITVGGVRFGLRAIYQRTHSRDKTRVIIYGAGQSGRETAYSLFSGAEYAPVAFVDDKVELWGTQIAGLRVFAPRDLPRLIEDYHAEALLLAMPSVSRGTRANILRKLEELPVRVQTIPGMSDIVAGTQTVSKVTEVSIEDLLGRDTVPPVQDLMRRNIAGKSVMVTGAGGSIGSELCRQILSQSPRRLVLVEQSEYALYEIGQELTRLVSARRSSVEIVQVLGSVTSKTRMSQVIKTHSVQTIYHAAAYKHVPMVEENVIEGVYNNVFGTLAVAQAAKAAGVASFTLISTDKAVRPTSVMGASKRMAELVCQALAQEGGSTCFSMVRFGNVLGSSGSVIPEFRRQIDAGGPVMVTHPEIMRYFMTIPEASQLVIQSSGLATGGDVFLLDMGEAVRIRDLAARMIRLSGFTPVLPGESAKKKAGDQGRASDAMPIVYTQPRPGEKLFEELFIGAIKEPTSHPRILTAIETSLEWPRLQQLLDMMREAIEADDQQKLRRILSDAPIAYAPRRAGLSRSVLEDQPDDLPEGGKSAAKATAPAKAALDLSMISSAAGR